MLFVMTACALLVVTTTMIHHLVLRRLHLWLPEMRIPSRMKLVVVLLGAFVAHAIEIALYGFAIYLLVTWLDVGHLTGSVGFSLTTCMYFSAETYTSLGFGDVTPVGPVRLLAGVEALNGLLLIGWTGSFTYISLERFWTVPQVTERPVPARR